MVGMLILLWWPGHSTWRVPTVKLDCVKLVRSLLTLQCLAPICGGPSFSSLWSYRLVLCDLCMHSYELPGRYGGSAHDFSSWCGHRFTMTIYCSVHLRFLTVLKLQHRLCWGCSDGSLLRMDARRLRLTQTAKRWVFASFLTILDRGGAR